jgi:hypothetical protein
MGLGGGLNDGCSMAVCFGLTQQCGSTAGQGQCKEYVFHWKLGSISIGWRYDLPLPLIWVSRVRMRDFLMAILSSEWPSFIVILVMRFCNWCNLWKHLPLSFFLLLMMMIFLVRHRIGEPIRWMQIIQKIENLK